MRVRVQSENDWRPDIRYGLDFTAIMKTVRFSFPWPTPPPHPVWRRAASGVWYAPASPLSLSASLLFRAELRCYNFLSCLPCPLGFLPLYMLILTSGFRPISPEPEEPTSKKPWSGFMNRSIAFLTADFQLDPLSRRPTSKITKIPQLPPSPSLNQKNPRIRSNLGP